MRLDLFRNLPQPNRKAWKGTRWNPTYLTLPYLTLPYLTAENLGVFIHDSVGTLGRRLISPDSETRNGSLEIPVAMCINPVAAFELEYPV